jgi:hypothetical protein
MTKRKRELQRKETEETEEAEAKSGSDKII